jgi:hypothetical protein
LIFSVSVLGPPEDTPAARTAFFTGNSGAKYSIGGVLFSPDDIEHGILRWGRQKGSDELLLLIDYYINIQQR